MVAVRDFHFALSCVCVCACFFVINRYWCRRARGCAWVPMGGREKKDCVSAKNDDTYAFFYCSVHVPKVDSISKFCTYSRTAVLDGLNP